MSVTRDIASTTGYIQNDLIRVEFDKLNADIKRVKNLTNNYDQIFRANNNSGSVPINAAGALLVLGGTEQNEFYHTNVTPTELTNAGNTIFKQLEWFDSTHRGGVGTRRAWFTLWDKLPLLLVFNNWTFNTAQSVAIRTMSYSQDNSGVTLYSSAQRFLSAAGTGQDYVNSVNTTRGGLSIRAGEWRTGSHDRNYEGSTSDNNIPLYAYLVSNTITSLTTARSAVMIFSSNSLTTNSALNTEASLWQTNWESPPTVANARLVLVKGTAPADSTGNNDLVSGFDRIANAFTLEANADNAVEVVVKPFSASVPYKQPRFVIKNYTVDFKPTVKKNGTTLVEDTHYQIYVDAAADTAYVHIFSDSVVSTSGTTYSVEALVVASNSVGIKYNVLNEITKFVPVNFNLYKTITKSVALTYNVKTVVTKSVALTYLVKQQINKTVGIQYKLHTTITRTRAIVYNVKTVVTTNRAITYKILQTVAITLTQRTAMVQLATRQYATRYKILSVTTKTLGIAYNLKKSNRTSVDVSYKLLIEITKSLPVNYVLTGPQTSTHPITYNIFQEITKFVAIQYNVYHRVSSTLTTLASMPAEGTTGIQRLDLTAPTHVFNTVTEDPLPIIYRVLTTVTQSVVVEYNVTRVDVGTDLDIVYRMRSPGEVEPYRTLALFYNVYEEVNETTDLGAELTADIGIRYTISQEVTQTRELNWWIIREITKKLGINYAVSIGGFKKLGVRYGLLKSVTNSLAVYTNVRDSVRIDIPVRYNTLVSVKLGLKLSFALLKSISNYVLVKYGTIKEVNKMHTIAYHLLYSVTRSRQINYIVIGRATRTLTSVASMDQEIGTRLRIDYAVTKTIDKSLELSWKIFYETSRSILVYYGIIGNVGQNLTVNNYLNGKIIKDFKIVRDFGGPVHKTVGLGYKVVHTVRRSAGFSYKLSSAVSKSRGINYHLLTSARATVPFVFKYSKSLSADLSMEYKLVTTLVKTLAISYATIIRIQVVQPVGIKYGLKTVVAPVDLQIRHFLLTTLTANVDINYMMLSTVTKAVGVNYRVMTYAYGEIKVRYKTLTPTLKTVAMTANLKQSASENVDVSYAVFATVAKSVAVTYKVIGGSSGGLAVTYKLHTPITKDLSIRYALSGAVTLTVAVAYVVVESVGVSVYSLAHIIGQIIKALPLTHKVLEPVGKPLSIGYNVRGLVTKQVALIYSTKASIVSTLKINYELDHAENLMLPPQPTDVYLDVTMDLAPPQPRGVYLDAGTPGE